MTFLPRGDGVTAWRRIADELEAAIRDHVFPPGSQLPTEARFAERFAVNRHTVRRAIAALVAKGLLRASRGSGTFVELPPIAYPIGPRTRFTETVTREGRLAGGRLLEGAEVAADAGVAAALAIAAGAPVLRARMKRFIDGTPVSLALSHLPLPRFAGFLEAFGRDGAVTPALAACGVGDYRRIETRISARAATLLEASELDLAPGRIVLTVRGLNVDPAGVPVQLTDAVFAADRMELVVDS